YEKDGFYSLWYPDHLMSFFPESIWSPETTSLATFLKSPHDVYNVFPTMTMAANNTKKILLGTGVTETFRYHPAVLAQIIITLDHLSKGRIILGIGAGEKENIVPYGIKWENPVNRLEEALNIVKLLWENDKKIDFNGKIWKLEDAVLSLKPYKKSKPPPIWIGAHGPKMLELTGKVGDGWLPVNLNLRKYKESLNQIQTSAKKAGRESKDITPAIWLGLITNKNGEEVDKMLESLIAKNHLLTRSSELFRQYGFSHPLGDNFRGIIDYIPTKYDKKTTMEALERISFQMCKELILNGTPDEIIAKIEEYAKVGAKHIILVDIAIQCDLFKGAESYNCMKEVITYFKGK
ncbi:MAG: LLM class flavin-dependent oxidoreductase, partial [Candidatus Hermodarchaeota archaeon]